jgi:hypothetical protein
MGKKLPLLKCGRNVRDHVIHFFMGHFNESMKKSFLSNKIVLTSQAIGSTFLINLHINILCLFFVPWCHASNVHPKTLWSII